MGVRVEGGSVADTEPGVQTYPLHTCLWRGGGGEGRVAEDRDGKVSRPCHLSASVHASLISCDSYTRLEDVELMGEGGGREVGMTSFQSLQCLRAGASGVTWLPQFGTARDYQVLLLLSLLLL